MLAVASGPADRFPTNPQSVVSTVQVKAAPVKVADLLQTTRIAGATSLLTAAASRMSAMPPGA
jgi:hypothetical protein